MRRLLLTVTFLTVFVGTLIASVPLSFAMRSSGVTAYGVSWQQARGTIWNGQVTGLGFNGRWVGSAEGDFSFVRLLTGNPAHLVSWSGPEGHGRALVGFSGNALRVEQGQAVLSFDATRISAIFPQQSVSMRLSNVAMKVGRQGCRAASGKAATDAFTQISSAYGATWPDLSGSLTCESGELVVSLEGQAADGTHIAAKAWLNGGGRLELWDVPEEQTSALLLAGFTQDAGKYVYLQQTPNGAPN